MIFAIDTELFGFQSQSYLNLINFATESLTMSTTKSTSKIVKLQTATIMRHNRSF